MYFIYGGNAIMKISKLIVLGLALILAHTTFAGGNKPKHKHKQDKSQKIDITGYTVDNNGMVKDNAGLVLGKLNPDGTIVDVSGTVIGHLGLTDAQKIGRVYFSD